MNHFGTRLRAAILSPKTPSRNLQGLQIQMGPNMPGRVKIMQKPQNAPEYLMMVPTLGMKTVKRTQAVQTVALTRTMLTNDSGSLIRIRN